MFEEVAMIHGLHVFLITIWQSNIIPPKWKRGLVTPIWKEKGACQDCKVLAHLFAYSDLHPTAEVLEI